MLILIVHELGVIKNKYCKTFGGMSKLCIYSCYNSGHQLEL